MAEQRIAHADGTTTVISDTYGFGSFYAGPPTRPEPERLKVQWLEQKAVQKKFGWSDGDFQGALQHEFPVACQREYVGQWGTVLIWREHELDAWAAAKRDEAVTLLRLVGSGS